jgi:Transposase zinc-binding domain
MSAIALCRTAALGGHAESCADCGFVRHAYNSCRNCHFPNSASAISLEKAGLALSHSTAIRVTVVCSSWRFAKDDCNTAQGYGQSWSMCCSFPRRPGARRNAELR